MHVWLLRHCKVYVDEKLAFASFFFGATVSHTAEYSSNSLISPAG
jgi:hypothetical protein